MNDVNTSFDPSAMRDKIYAFPDHAVDALKIAATCRITIPRKSIRSIVVTGLGGSAIGGDLLRSFASGELGVPMSVNRGYSLPAYVDSSTLVIVSSYSGNTEETVAAHKEAIKRGARVVAITTGGMTQKIAKRNRQPIVNVPPGLPPRAALAYSFFPLLALFHSWGFIRISDRDIKETLRLLYSIRDREANPSTSISAALAASIRGTLPIIYSSYERFDAVSLRWRGQIEENAKSLAYGNVFPELNHNEIVGWDRNPDLLSRLSVIILRDNHDHPRVSLRMDITADLIKRYSSGNFEIQSEGRSLLARMFSLIHLGDWTSYYLAEQYGVDPSPVANIDYLKSKLASS